jgi:hypothetical protein
MYRFEADGSTHTPSKRRRSRVKPGDDGRTSIPRSYNGSSSTNFNNIPRPEILKQVQHDEDGYCDNN